MHERGRSTGVVLTVSLLAGCAGRAQPRTLAWLRSDDVELPRASELVDVAGEAIGQCGVRIDGALLCWRPSDTQARIFVPDAAITELALAGEQGFGRGCVRDAAARVACWSSVEELYLGPRMITGLARLRGEPTQLAVSQSHACARMSSGRVACWGAAGHGQLGWGVDQDCEVLDPWRSSTQADLAEGIEDAVAVAVGQAFTCSVHVDGSLRCWGHSDFTITPGSGRLHCSRPHVVEGLSQIAHVSIADQVACVLDRAGVVRCWGSPDLERGPIPVACAVPLPSAARDVEVMAFARIRASLDDGRELTWQHANFCEADAPSVL